MREELELRLSDVMRNCDENVHAYLKSAYKRGYNCGLNDAWEYARKIACADGLSYDELYNIFGYRATTAVFNLFTASEAIAKIQEFEGKQKQTNKTSEQQIGKSCTNCKYHVTNCYPYPNFCYLIRKGLSCTNFSEWESNVVEELYSNEVNNND